MKIQAGDLDLRILAAVRAGACSGMRVARVLGMNNQLINAPAYRLVQRGLLCALDGDPWCLTLAGMRELLGPARFPAWWEEHGPRCPGCERHAQGLDAGPCRWCLLADQGDRQLVLRAARVAA